METQTAPHSISQMIDHTLLRPETTLAQIETLCEEAVTHKFFSVCVNPVYVATAALLLKDTGVKVCTVVGFPLGANGAHVKAFEATQVVKDGADEIDMVIDLGALKSQKLLLVEEDIRGVVSACRGKIVKVIIETSLLTNEEKVSACKMAERAGAHFIKTSTGMNGEGATLENIKLIKETVSPSMGIKASGGIRDLATAKKMLEAGATRLGTSNGIKILKGLDSTDFY